MTYNTNRSFTDKAHHLLADLYKSFNWLEVKPNNSYRQAADSIHKIDYHYIDEEKNLIAVQERFRCRSAMNYNDIAIRLSGKYYKEAYSIVADFLIYGVVDSITPALSPKQILKYVMLDVSLYREYLDKERIVFDEELYTKTSVFKDNRIICPVKSSTDNEFITIDVKHLNKLNPDLIIMQENFNMEC